MTTPDNHTFTPETAAIWGAFLYEGLMMAEYKLGEEKTLIDYYAYGYIEMISELTEYLQKVWEMAITEPRFFSDSPGMFEYEVISPLGEYLGEQLVKLEGQLPKNEEIEAALKHLVLSFFEQPKG